MSAPDGGLIEWGTAEAVAGAVAGDGPDTELLPEDRLIEVSDEAVERVIDFTGLEPAGAVPQAELISRSEWIGVNLETLRTSSALLEERLADGIQIPGPIGNASRGAIGHVTGGQAGLALGFAARNVLGQYDMSLLGEVRPARLLFVGPNLVQGREKIGGSEESFVRWIALHEGTHAVHFGAVPWLREHLGGMLRELLEATPVEFDLSRISGLVRSALPPDPRRLISGLRSADPVRLMMGERSRQILDRTNTTMAMVEGYAEHVMDALGETIDPEVVEMRGRLEQRRRDRSGLEVLIGRILGLEMKLKQYRDGKLFCDAVVAGAGGGSAGLAQLNRAWDSPEALPTPAELADPSAWLARV